jgi:hypothetical protein
MCKVDKNLKYLLYALINYANQSFKNISIHIIFKSKKKRFGEKSNLSSNPSECTKLNFCILSERIKARLTEDEVAEWLRRLPAKQLCSAREGSNPFLVEFFFSQIEYLNSHKYFGKNSTRKGFEPSRAEHNCLAGNRLNHSATSSFKRLLLRLA